MRTSTWKAAVIVNVLGEVGGLVSVLVAVVGTILGVRNGARERAKQEAEERRRLLDQGRAEGVASQSPLIYDRDRLKEERDELLNVRRELERQVAALEAELRIRRERD